MHVETLQKVVDLSETLNFTETARRFYITQPGLSRQVAKFESEIGITVFDRQQHGMSVTKEGQTVIEGARKVISAYDSFMGMVHALSGGFREMLTVGYLIAASRPFLTTSSLIFQSVAPSTNVHFIPMTAREINEAIADGSVDIAITASSYVASKHGWKSIAIYEDTYAFAMSARHRLAKKGCVSKADLYGERIALPASEFNPGERELVLSALADVPFEAVVGTSTGINDLSFIVSDAQTVAPVLSHIRFYGDPDVVFVPAEESLLGAASVIATWSSENEKESIPIFIDAIRSSSRFNKPRHSA